jgi:hypothetical protein
VSAVQTVRTGASCGRCQTPIESGDLRCAICALAVPEAGRAPLATREVVKIVRCDRCGAATTYSAEVHGSRCAFCGAVTRLEEPEDPPERAEGFLPFRVAPDTAQQALGAWMRSLGFFRPSDLATAARIENVRALFWCAWVFDADALVSWTADSNAGSRRSAWAPHAGQVRLGFERVLVSASRGLTEPECRRLAGAFDLSTARATAEGPPGATIEHFDVQRAAARGIIADAIQTTAIDRLTRGGHVPGDRYRNVRSEILVHALVTRRLAMPTFVTAYRYRGKLYRALVHGQDARHVFGDAPYSWAKISLVVLGGVAALAAIVAIAVAVLGR